ncbi:MAG: glutaminase A [Synergistaceae bacterium]|jgi:glutaminase|nr:glutaminase A [Synergistaceae bacterium]
MENKQELQSLLDRTAAVCRSLTGSGRQATYIPELATVDPSLFALSAVTLDGAVLSSGDIGARFSMQSMSKVMSLSFALERLGYDEVFSHVGMEPCSEPFNSIMKLEMTSDTPLNPFINSGSIIMAGLLAERLGSGVIDEMLDFASRMTGNKSGLAVNERVYRSESSTADRNRALAYFMHSSGALSFEVEKSLDLYFRLCSIEVGTDDLAVMGATLANAGKNPLTKETIVSVDTSYTVIGIMSVCGLYDESGWFAVKAGVPAKSGVSGGIVCAVPGRMGLAVFSPPLGKGGNSVAGVEAVSRLSKELKLRGI